MRCPNCGTEITDDSRFCMECGYKINEAQQNAVEQQQPPTPHASATSNAQRSTSNSLYCPMCGIENSSRDSFCKMCGASLKLKGMTDCPHCGVEMPKEDKYCPNCGMNVLATRTPTPPAGLPPVAPPSAAPPVAAPPVQQAPPPGAPVAHSAPPPMAPPPANLKIAGVPVAAPAVAPNKDFAKTIMQQAPSAKTNHGRTLAVLKGERAGEKFPFTQSLTVGRTQGEIVFPNDEYLDSRHFSISVTPKGVHLKDLDSVNGLFYRLSGEIEAFSRTMFILDDYLFMIEELTPTEWSLNGVWERGVKLMGSLKNQSPWARVRFFSPLGTTAGVYLLWDEEEVIGHSYLPGACHEGHATCRILRRSKKIYLSPKEGDLYVKLNGEMMLSLPIQLRCGLQTMEITSF
ncbi:zinc-ribbon domain-containing protein [Myxococcota bacterium]|nr:zinc-ribbon domain-containing protein [Myxococcota bacterium]